MEANTRKSSGFSLIELMVVVAVFGLLLTIAIPAINGYLRSSRLTGAAHTIESDIHYGHMIAHEQARTYQILFHPTTYTLMAVSPASTLLTRTMPTGVTCASTDTAKFYAWGLTKPVTVTVTSSRGTHTVQLLTNGSVTHD